MSSISYGDQLPEFNLYMLSWSWLIAIKHNAGELRLVLEAALSPEHPDHEPPPAGTAACWRPALMKFNNVLRLVAVELDLYVHDVDDPDGAHLGELWWIGEEDNHFLLGGDFGELEIWSDRPTIELISREQQGLETRR